MRSEATTPEAYLAELPEDRRDVVSAVRDLVLANLPAGYEESMNWGMISYEVPLERYPDTYNGQPLGYIALASQKRNCALYMNGIYMSEERRKAFEAGFAVAGKKLDIGKSCVRFRTLSDLPLDHIAETVAAVDVDEFVALYERSRHHR